MKDCKGCSIKHGCDMSSFFIHKEQIYKCPCSECLVKPACTKSCDHFDAYVHIYYKHVQGNDHIIIDKNEYYNLYTSEDTKGSDPKVFFKLSHLRRVPIKCRMVETSTRLSLKGKFPFFIMSTGERFRSIKGVNKEYVIGPQVSYGLMVNNSIFQSVYI